MEWDGTMVISTSDIGIQPVVEQGGSWWWLTLQKDYVFLGDMARIGEEKKNNLSHKPALIETFYI